MTFAKSEWNFTQFYPPFLPASLIEVPDSCVREFVTNNKFVGTWTKSGVFAFELGTFSVGREKDCSNIIGREGVLLPANYGPVRIKYKDTAESCTMLPKKRSDTMRCVESWNSISTTLCKHRRVKLPRNLVPTQVFILSAIIRYCANINFHSIVLQLWRPNAFDRTMQRTMQRGGTWK